MFCKLIQESAKSGENGRYMSKRAVNRSDSSIKATAMNLKAERLDRTANWNIREAEALERQLEEDTAHLETLQIEMRIKMNEKKEAEMKMERKKKRLKKIDREDQSGFCTYPEVD